jgi:peroxiredoxin
MDTTSTPTLAEQAAEVQAASAGRLPDEVRAIFGAQVADLEARGVPAGVAQPGFPLPDVTMLDPHGAETSLHAVIGETPTVIVFYRGTWCPYCNAALRTYGTQLVPALAERGAQLIAVSPQKPDGSLSMQEKHELSFPVLSDPGNALATALGVLMPDPGEEVLAAQRRLGLDVTEVNADGTGTLPLATVAIAGPDTVLRWIDVRPNYTARTEVAEILGGYDATA